MTEPFLYMFESWKHQGILFHCNVFLHLFHFAVQHCFLPVIQAFTQCDIASVQLFNSTLDFLREM